MKTLWRFAKEVRRASGTRQKNQIIFSDTREDWREGGVVGESLTWSLGEGKVPSATRQHGRRVR